MRHEPHVRVQLFRGGGVPKEVHGEVKPRNIHGSLREVLPALDVAARVRSAWQIHQDLDPHPRRCRLPWTDRHPRTISGLAALPTSLCKSPFNASHAAFRESEQCNGRSRMEPIAGARRCVTPTKRSDLLRERRLRCPLVGGESMSHHDHQTCMEACIRCAVECERCGTKCIEEGRPECAKTCIDCADICWTCASFLSRSAALVPEICKVSARACDDCAAECENHDIEHCKRCAIACHQCADKCREMAVAEFSSREGRAA